MKKKDTVLFGGILAVLTAANAALDYIACAEVICDVDAFSETMSFGNLIALTMALGTALILMGLPFKAAKTYAAGRKVHWIPLLCGCGLIAATISGLRLAGLTDGGNASISGEGAIGADLESLMAVALMFVMSAGESTLAFFHKLEEIKEEHTRLCAALTRIEADIDSIGKQKRAAARITNERMLEATETCKQANERVLQAMLGKSGGYQDSFIGYTTEGEKARSEFADNLNEKVRSMLIDPDPAAEMETDSQKREGSSRTFKEELIAA